jgi:2-keto-4-pentenoate hydratase/2-oxohepta-3-ene-1,7-dioic acid hydratase in catechol pathway
MRLATIAFQQSTSAALVTDGQVAPVRDLPGRDDAVDVRALITRPLTEDERSILAATGSPADKVRFLPPLTPPKNVFCVGKNYLEHVREGARAEGVADAKAPQFPVWFTKPHTALIGHGDAIVADDDFTQALDYEGELAVVIGRRCRDLTTETALSAVFGYTVFNDVTARDVQRRHLQWFRGKSADSYGPMGPWIVTADEVDDPQALAVRTLVNGDIRQQDNTKNMIFRLPDLLVNLSQGVTLEPGDIIATGTPSGVAWGMDAPTYLRPGDEVIVEIEGIGALRNVVRSK